MHSFLDIAMSSVVEKIELVSFSTMSAGEFVKVSDVMGSPKVC